MKVAHRIKRDVNFCTGIFPLSTLHLLTLYQLLTSSFEVDTATGVISTTAPLDYEERTIYHLTLVAEDGGGTLTDPNRGNTQIVIEVLDENDNIPVCFPTSTTVNLEENIVHTNFLTITVRNSTQWLILESVKIFSSYFRSKM